MEPRNTPTKNADQHADTSMEASITTRSTTAFTIEGAALMFQELIGDTIANCQRIHDDNGEMIVLHRNNGDDAIIIRQGDDIIDLSERTNRLLAKRMIEMGLHE